MIKFIIGLAIVVSVVVGGYYYWFMREPEVQQQQRQPAAAAQVQIKTNSIPAGAVMEDGTIPE